MPNGVGAVERSVSQALLILLAVGVGTSVIHAGEPRPTAYLQGTARVELLRALDARGRSYDPQAKMTLNKRIKRADYTRLAGKSGHPTRESLDYAAHLLEANDAEHRERACEIIAKVISLQDSNPGSLTYGLWPWYAEEPLKKMFLPDYNWAAFLGKTLLYILIHHEQQLPPELKTQVRESIVRACTCIYRRPLHVGYTNIAAMSSYCLLVAGERLPDPRILAFGQKLFDAWYDYTIRQGSFTEFNSPTYTRVALDSVSRMLADLDDPQRRAKAETINRMLWTHLARRFHEPTWQWSGPYSRAYYYLESGHFVRMIQRAIGGAVQFVPPENLGPDVWDWRNPHRAPVDLAGYFKPLTAPREEIEVFFKAGEELPNGLGLKGGRISQIPIVGTTYLHPRFALGSVNICDFWEQHMNLIAHWGSHDEPAYMAMGCRHERHGFCSAALASVQHKGNVLAAVGFMTDFGDQFIDIDRLPNQTLKCENLRVEFEFGGNLSNPKVPDRVDLNSPIVVTDRGTRIAIQYLGGTLAGETPAAEIARGGHGFSVMFYLYKGAPKSFRLPDLEEAGALFAVRVSEDREGAPPIEQPKTTIADGISRAEWEVDGARLLLQGSSRPLSFTEMQKRLTATIDGKPRWESATPLLPSPPK